MKTRFFYLAALLVIGSTVGAVAKEEPTTASVAVVAVKGSDVVRVIYKGITAGKVKVNIYNASSKVVFSESRNTTNGFILPLNFSGLQSGEYTVEVVDAIGSKSEKINYQPLKSETAVHVARLAESGKFLLSVADNGSEVVTVKIFDEFNNLIHTSSKQFEDGFAQIFSIKSKTVGSYTFEVINSEGNTTTVRI